MALPFAVTFPTPDSVNSTAYEKSKVISETPATLYGVDVFNKGAADAYLMLFDATSLPANGTFPVAIAFAPKGVTSGLDFSSRGRKFSTGIVAALSSSNANLQLISATDGHFHAQVQ